jgi:HKD family nuclease
MQNELKQTEEIAIDVSSINYKTVETPDFLVNNKLIVNSEKGNLLNELKACLNECESFYFSVAFINFSGLQLLLDSFKAYEKK